MELKLPSEISVTDLWPSSIRLVLPKRELGKGRIVSWLLFGVGLLLVSMTVNAVLAFFKVCPWVFGGCFGPVALMALFPTLGGIIPLWWGAVGLWGHRELEITPDRLRTIERLGPFWRSKRWKIANISHFEVVPAVPGSKGQPTPEVFKLYNALLVKFEAAQQGMLAWGYPDELLRTISAALAECCNSALERAGLPADVQAASEPKKSRQKNQNLADDEQSQTDEDLDDDLDEEEEDIVDDEGPPRQPANTPIEIERFEGGLSIRVPAAGLKGTKGLFFFSLLWNGFMTVFTSFAGVGLFQGKAQADDLWIMIPFISLFWLIGIGIFLGSLSMARRRAGIAVADGTLMILQTGLFRSKQREWPVADLAAIRVGPSGMEVNDVPVNELQIHGTDGKKFGALAGRSDAELAWIAVELRQSLGVPSVPRES